MTKSKVKTTKEPLLSSAKPEFHLVPRTKLHHQRCESQTATRPKPKPESPDWLKTVVAQPRRRARRVTSVYATRSVVRWRTTNDTTNFGGDRNHRDRETAGGKSSIPALLNLLDASDCDGCTGVASLEAWFNMELDLEDASDAWRDVRLGLCGDGAAAPFMQISGARRAAPARPRSTPRRRPTRLRRR